jgi:hypothetical protein
MARSTNRLSAKTVASIVERGYYADRAGLYLQVSASGSKSWIFRFMHKGKEREMGLGSLADVKLADARQKRDEHRKLLREGVDPLEARKRMKIEDALVQGRSITFSAAAAAYIRTYRPSWKNVKHGDQWTNTLATYCNPIFGEVPVQYVDTSLLLKALQAIWTEKPETASRIRGRIECVLDWAKVSGYRDGENPARWHGHLDKLLPKLEKHKPVKHRPTLPFADIAQFVKALRLQVGSAAPALEFLIPTATRTNEAVQARWSESTSTPLCGRSWRAV